MGSAMANAFGRRGLTSPCEIAPIRPRRKSRAPSALRVPGLPPTRHAAADITLSSLADDQAVRDVYMGAHGAASGLREGAVVAEMSTIAPRTVREILPAVESRHALLVDGPVSGSVAFAERGS